MTDRMQAYISPGKRNTRTASNRSPQEIQETNMISPVKKTKDNTSAGNAEEDKPVVYKPAQLMDFFSSKRENC